MADRHVLPRKVEGVSMVKTAWSYGKYAMSTLTSVMFVWVVS